MLENITAEQLCIMSIERMLTEPVDNNIKLIAIKVLINQYKDRVKEECHEQ